MVWLAASILVVANGCLHRLLRDDDIAVFAVWVCEAKARDAEVALS